MICQIYSATSPDEGLALIDAGTQFVGIFPIDDFDYRGLFSGDPTIGSHVSFAMAQSIIEAVRGRATSVVLSLSNDHDEMLGMADRFRPDVLHVSGPAFRADEVFRDDLRAVAPETKLMHVVEVIDRSSMDAALEETLRLQPIADYLILDTGAGAAIGASGRTHDWEVSKKVVESSKVPVILAGGLEPGNVASAVRFVRPWGVDSFTKTNRFLPDGTFVKDIDRVREFCREAKGAEQGAVDGSR